MAAERTARPAGSESAGLVGTIRTHLRTMPAVRYLIFGMLTLELVVIVVLPLLVPRSLYLRSYLEEAAEVRTLIFSRDEDPYLMWDSLAGWRNRPLARNDRWEMDQFGSRSSESLSRAHGQRRRLVFLGSSMTNGGMHVANGETVSAYASDSTTECLNFATMAYSVDQAVLLYEETARHFEGDVVVLGLDDSPEAGLGNRYIPLRRRDEVNMPYPKPRFELADSQLHLLLPPSKGELASLLKDDEFLSELEASDTYYANFARFMRFGQLPLSASLLKGYEKAERLLRAVSKPEEDRYLLLLALLHKLSREVTADGARLVVMTMPSFETAFPASWRQRLPDPYGDLLARLREEEFLVVDGRQVLRDLNESPGSLFAGDRVHYKPQANRALAAALTRTLDVARLSSRPAGAPAGEP